MKTKYIAKVVLLTIFFSVNGIISCQKIDDYRYDNGQLHPVDHAVRSEVRFNGYTNHWHDTYDKWYRYGNLFKMAVSDVEKTILQSKVDIAEDMGIPGLIMQEGFMNALLSGSYTTLEQPDPDQLEEALSAGNVLVFLDPGTEAGEMVTSKLPADWEWPRKLKSHQYGAVSLARADLFLLENGENKLFVVSSPDEATRGVLGEQIETTAHIL